jgi:threonine dehydratase
MPDRPGSIVDLAAIAASQKASILDIHHGRTFTSASFRETEIELMVETRGPEAVDALLKLIAAKGYRVEMFTFE